MRKEFSSFRPASALELMNTYQFKQIIYYRFRPMGHSSSILIPLFHLPSRTESDNPSNPRSANPLLKREIIESSTSVDYSASALFDYEQFIAMVVKILYLRPRSNHLCKRSDSIYPRMKSVYAKHWTNVVETWAAIDTESIKYQWYVYECVCRLRISEICDVTVDFSQFKPCRMRVG